LNRHPKFDINLHQLDDRFKRLQFQVHPDRFSTASEEEQAAAASQAARLNTSALSCASLAPSVTICVDLMLMLLPLFALQRL
jgi:hypothetical protein